MIGLNSRNRTRFRIALAALLAACALPLGGCSSTPASSPSGPLTGAVAGGALAAPQRARYIYFAGIQSARGGQGGFLGPGELGVYAATANGNVAPRHIIAGMKTGLYEAGGCCVPQSAWFDLASHSIWTCRTFSKFISRFAIETGEGSWGNVEPSDRLAISPKTVSCGGVAVAENGDIVADDINAAFVATWPAGSTGNTAPIRTISGSKTSLFLPSAIAFDGNGDYLVSDRCTPPQCSGTNGGEILTFAANAGGNVSPLRNIVGEKTRLSGPNRIAFDPVHNLIYAANLYSSTITAYPAGSSGNAAPAIVIAGKQTQLWNPDAIAIDRAGYLYVGNEPLVPGPPPASILVFAPGANGNVAPLQIITGSKTQLAELNGLSVR